ncbi:UDP-glucose/GDP-mannose dehydrogenase family protein [Paenibacillus lycopersici]|uniref:UDP-glucose 6-dehydrogenase n=1 Tax=Paenibacillus lycopersici TaxID=2704462 RepID=A0A6C0FXA2_9BACL|nr:UDP-glucose/GDP-mannose dehydrogenase family protein [Paenibacillus lycopersici]QHT59914.1 UDP-glucose/GDP-mannose dehydrogenase family protein [Paenibacillus lycopersici]
MRVLIVGSGYVGLTTGSALAYLGHEITLLDIDADRIMRLKDGEVPIHEKGLNELLSEARHNMNFISTWNDFDSSADIVIIAVGTPNKGNGDVDLTYVEVVAKSIGERLNPDSETIIINKSTVPIGSARRVKTIIEQELKKRNIVKSIDVASNPEFLREGEALFDTLYPDRIVIGTESQSATNRLLNLYKPLLEQSFIPPISIKRPEGLPLPSIITTSPTSAELIKYAANSFLAMKISFINEFAGLAELVGADIKEVTKGIGQDSRIGSRFLNAGIGWGGSCFGKDTAAIMYTANQYNFEMPLVHATIKTNYKQRESIIRKLQSELKVLRGSTIGVLGLAFKPNTDDLRDAPSIDIIRGLLELGANVKVFDPVAMNNCKKQYPNLNVVYTQSADEIFEDSHGVVLITEWEEFLHLPYLKLANQMKNKLIIDGRNVLDKELMLKCGVSYKGIGRGE